MSNRVILARSALALAVRRKGDVVAARQELSTAKAVRAVSAALAEGISADNVAELRALLDAASPPSADDPLVGSRWRNAESGKVFTVESVYDDTVLARYAGQGKTASIKLGRLMSSRYARLEE